MTRVKWFMDGVSRRGIEGAKFWTKQAAAINVLDLLNTQVMLRYIDNIQSYV